MDPNNPKYAGKFSRIVLIIIMYYEVSFLLPDQEQVFQALGMDILHNSFAGYNACIFAYGQTGNNFSIKSVKWFSGLNDWAYCCD